MKKTRLWAKKQSQFKPNQSQFFQRQTGPSPESLIRLIWSHNKSGPFEKNLSRQYLHMTYLVLTLLLGKNISQLFLWGSLFFRIKRHLAHQFFGGVML